MGDVEVVLKAEERGGRKYVTLWYGDKKIRKRAAVYIKIGKDGSVKDSSVRSVRRFLEHAPVTYSPKGARDGFAVYFMAESDESVRAAIEESIAKGSSTLPAKIKLLRFSKEEAMLSIRLWNRKIPNFRNVYVEGYNVDILIPDYKIVVEVDGLKHYQERIQEKDVKKLELLKKKGYEIFRIQASDIRRDPSSIAEMIRDHCRRRLENSNLQPQPPTSQTPTPES